MRVVTTKVILSFAHGYAAHAPDTAFDCGKNLDNHLYCTKLIDSWHKLLQAVKTWSQYVQQCLRAQ